jgi:hypothetical protein
VTSTRNWAGTMSRRSASSPMTCRACRQHGQALCSMSTTVSIHGRSASVCQIHTQNDLHIGSSDSALRSKNGRWDGDDAYQPSITPLKLWVDWRRRWSALAPQLFARASASAQDAGSLERLAAVDLPLRAASDCGFPFPASPHTRRIPGRGDCAASRDRWEDPSPRRPAHGQARRPGQRGTPPRGCRG